MANDVNISQGGSPTLMNEWRSLWWETRGTEVQSMPVLELLDQKTPRSVVRHRPLSTQLPPGYQPQVARASRLRARATSEQAGQRKRPMPSDDADARDDDDLAGYHPLPQTPVRHRGSATPKAKRSLPSVLLLGLGMLVMGLIWIGFTHLVSWGQMTLDDLRYGRPRVFQMDTVVGHHDSQASPTHLLAINLKGQIEVIEWPAGSSSHARIYLGPHLFGTDADLAPVTLQVEDVNGDHRPDIVLYVQTTQMVLLNDQDGFRPLRPGEHISLQL
jgi:hypothetical protein